MSSRLVVAAFAFGAAGVFLNSASFADLTTDTSATDANDLGEVVVTAQRKEESVQTTSGGRHRTAARYAAAA